MNGAPRRSDFGASVRLCSIKAILLGLLVVVSVAPGQAVAAASPGEAVDEEQSPDTGVWRFRVLLDDDDIGHHRFHVRRTGDRTEVEIDARFDVRFLFFTAYRYRHENQETWRDGCLVGMRSSTRDGGDDLAVRGAATGQTFTVSAGGSTREIESACVRSFAYWNPDLLTAGKLLNAQTGEWVEASLEQRGEERVTVGGREVAAVRYNLVLEVGVISLWYAADDGRWLALEAPARGDRVLRYQLEDTTGRLDEATVAAP